MMCWNSCSERSASQFTARSAIGTPQVRPLSPFTCVIAEAHWPARIGPVPSPNANESGAAMLIRQ